MMMTYGKIFQKRMEDFVCEQCEFPVVGDGYTNHCPRCLYSKHVDIHPGDRLASCGGLMEPVSCIRERGQEKLLQRCKRCGFERNNKVQREDNFEALLGVARRQAARGA